FAVDSDVDIEADTTFESEVEADSLATLLVDADAESLTKLADFAADSESLIDVDFAIEPEVDVLASVDATV
ncbi:hypothetical protein, partial [Staphylococcus intermedius]|uniref:hypothetical protein n=1 Tax=Staphylococcus intermedius TaxID=1285 RepID=UPI0005279B85